MLHFVDANSLVCEVGVAGKVNWIENPQITSRHLTHAKLSRDQMFPAEPPQVPSLASETITASRGSDGPRAGKSAARNLKKVKKPVSTLSAGLPPISEIDPSVLASLPPDIIAEIREAYGELPAHFVKDTKAKEGTLSSPTCGAIVGQNVNSRSKDLNLEVAVERRGLETATHEREVKQSPSKRGESSRMASETHTEIMALPPASQV